MYRLIVSDLDETLLRSDKTVSPADREAIAEAGRRGVKFVPASGRGFKSIAKTLKELDLYGKADEYVISFNGGAVTENRGERVLYHRGLPFEEAEELYRRGQDYDVHVYTLDTVYVYHFFPGEQAFLRGRMEVEEVSHTTLDFLRGQEIIKVLYTNTDHAYLTSIARDLESLTGDMDVSYSSGRYLEFNPAGVNKGAGLRKLAGILGIDMRDTIAVGDNYNDITMIEAAGLGVGVANTVEELKPRCDFVTEATHEESAIAEVIRKFILEA